MRKHNPRTKAVKSRRLREVSKYGLQHAGTSIGDVISTIAEFERLVDQFTTDFDEVTMLEDQKRDALKLILSREIEKALNLNCLGRSEKKDDESTHEELKAEIEDFVEECDSYTKPVRKAQVAAIGDQSKENGMGDQQ